MGETVLDEKGRVAIPKKIREQLGLRTGARMTVVTEGKRVVLSLPVSPEEFVREMEGFVKTELKEDPLRAKRIWEPKVK
jgi:AbrB family looped-hinge helix DNA binding protein